MARIRHLQTAVLQDEDPRSTRDRTRQAFLRELANTAGRLKQLQQENVDVRRRMDDVLRCNARMASMLNRQEKMLVEMSRSMTALKEERRSWFGRWIDGFRKAA